MKRRRLLKTLGLSVVGLATVPLWMECWGIETLPVVESKGNDLQKKNLAELVGMIIPATDTPGAKELGVDKFILTMVAECYVVEMQNKFLAGLDELNKAAMDQEGKPFYQLSDGRQAQLFLDSGNEQTSEGHFNFTSFARALVIVGYTSSEYYIKNVLHYELVPSRFNGSFPVNESIYRNA